MIFTDFVIHNYFVTLKSQFIYHNWCKDILWQNHDQCVIYEIPFDDGNQISQLVA